MNKVYRYAMVSTRKRDLSRQIQALISYGVSDTDIITNKSSGKDFNRTGYITLRDNLLRT